MKILQLMLLGSVLSIHEGAFEELTSEEIEKIQQGIRLSTTLSEEELRKIEEEEEKYINELKNLDIEEASRANERLSKTRERIQATQLKAQKAAEIWNALTPSQKERVAVKAKEAAEKKKKDFENDVKLTQKLKDKQKMEIKEQLNRQMDEKINIQNQEIKTMQEEQFQNDMQEFQQRQKDHQLKKEQYRTTTLALFFWIFLFVLSFTGARYIFPFKRKVE